MVRTAVETLAPTGVTGRGLVTSIYSATAWATKAATRTYRAMDLETIVVAGTVTTKKGASATDRVMIFMKATNCIPRSAYGCSMERETRATDTQASQRTGSRLASGYSMVKATQSAEQGTTQGTDCSLWLRREKEEQNTKDQKDQKDDSKDGRDPGAHGPGSCFYLPPWSALFSGSALAGGAHHLGPWLFACELLR